jgi:hypothetical protein
MNQLACSASQCRSDPLHRSVVSPARLKSDGICRDGPLASPSPVPIAHSPSPWIDFESTALATRGPASPFTDLCAGVTHPSTLDSLPFPTPHQFSEVGFCANLLIIVYCHDIAPPSLYIGSLRLHCDGDITHTHAHYYWCTYYIVIRLQNVHYWSSQCYLPPIDYRLLPRYRTPITLYW